MAFLHLINRANIDEIKRYINFNDSAILLENSLCELENLEFEAQEYFVLQDDFKKFQIEKKLANFAIKQIDYKEFVALTLDFTRVILWN